jgi:superoxide reductase
MTKLREVYKCNICFNVVEVLHIGADALVCCGQPMDKLEAKNEDSGNEKHVPVLTAVDGGLQVTVGSVEHPMEEKHYIQFIEVLTTDQVLRAELHPTQKPQATFQVDPKDVLVVREYCNIHGLWQTK